MARELFKRKIMERMRQWKRISDGRTALLIEGARRIGKTTVAVEFAKKEYQDYMVLDFARESQDIR